MRSMRPKTTPVLGLFGARKWTYYWQHEPGEESIQKTSAWNAATRATPITNTRHRPALASQKPDSPPQPVAAWNLQNPSARAGPGSAVVQVD